MTPRFKTLSSVLGMVVTVAVAVWGVRQVADIFAQRRPPPTPMEVAVPETPVEAPKVVEPEAAPPSPTAAATLLKPNAAYDRFIAATDLGVFYEDAMRAGSSPDYKFFASEAARICANWVVPLEKARETQTSLHQLAATTSDTPWKARALADVERCKGFKTLKVHLPSHAAVLRREAAADGSLPAIAAQLVLLRKTDPAAARAAAIRVLESRDAAAIVALWPYLAEDEAPKRMKELSSSSSPWIAEGWQAMACENGLECPWNSPVMRAACMGGERRCEGSFAEMLEKRSRQERQAIGGYRDFFAGAIRDGSWKRIGLL